MTPEANPLSAEGVARLVERVRRYLPALDAAAIPTKSEVFVLCGSEARQLHNDLSALSSLARERTIQWGDARFTPAEAVAALDGLRNRAETAEARVKELEKENEALRLEMLGGEDAPGYAASLSMMQVVQSFREHQATLRQCAEARAEAEERMKRVVEAAEKIERQIPVTRAYLVDNRIDPNFADVLLSHYADVARDLRSALPQEGSGK